MTSAARSFFVALSFAPAVLLHGCFDESLVLGPDSGMAGSTTGMSATSGDGSVTSAPPATETTFAATTNAAGSTTSMTGAIGSTSGSTTVSDGPATTTGETPPGSSDDGDVIPEVPGCEPGTEYVLDGSFEASSMSGGDGNDLNPYWSEFAINQLSPVCNASCVNGPSQASDGRWWVYFGGTGETSASAITQMVQIPEGVTQLRFSFRIPSPDLLHEDIFRVLIDEHVVFEATASDQGTYSDWTQVVVPIADHADGSTHTLAFGAQMQPSLPVMPTAFYVDDVSIACP